MMIRYNTMRYRLPLPDPDELEEEREDPDEEPELLPEFEREELSLELLLERAGAE